MWSEGLFGFLIGSMFYMHAIDTYNMVSLNRVEIPPLTLKTLINFGGGVGFIIGLLTFK